MADTALELIKKKPTEKEMKFLAETAKEGVTLEKLIPDDMDPGDLLGNMDIVCRGLARADTVTNGLIPVLGRMLAVAKSNPAVMEKAGVDTWDKFLEEKVYPYFQRGRSTAFFALRLAKRWPGLDTQTYTAVSRRGFQILMKAIPEKQTTEKWAKDLVKKAAKVSVDALEQHCEEQGYLTHNSVTGGIIRINCTKGFQREWEKFYKNKKINAYCGSKEQDVILNKLMQECEQIWMAHVETEAGGGNQSSPGGVE